MPDPGALVTPVVNTGLIFPDIVDNWHNMIVEHKADLSVQGKDLLEANIVKYDELKVYHTPFVSIIFDAGRTVESKINNCVEIGVDISTYFYFESLNFGVDTRPFLEPLWRLYEMFLVHWSLYDYTKGSSRNVEITNCALIGRKLDADVFLTGLLNATVYVRSCRCHAPY